MPNTLGMLNRHASDKATRPVTSKDVGKIK
jgi:hypothetical protein